MPELGVGTGRCPTVLIPDQQLVGSVELCMETAFLVSYAKLASIGRC